MNPPQQKAKVLQMDLQQLTREVAEIEAAEEIRRFYGDKPVPLPDGVVPPTEEELAAADAEQW